MSTSIDFAPLLPPIVLWVAIATAMLVALYGFLLRARGAWARTLAFAAILIVVANPLVIRETHAPLRDVVALILDQSQSMTVGNRAHLASSALQEMKKKLETDKSLDVRTATVATTTTGENNGTQLFAALNNTLADVPPERVAGAIAITDGEVHDAPEKLSLHARRAGLPASICALTGKASARGSFPSAKTLQFRCRSLTAART
jgi:hypothetical protein